MSSEWTVELQRLVLALAVRGDMLDRVPSAARPDAYSGGDLTNPRQRLAAMVTAFWEQYRSRPGTDALAQLVADERRKLGPAESDALAEEYVAILDVELPGDATWVFDRARAWSTFKRLEDGVLRSADLLREGGASSAQAVRDVLARASAEEDAGGKMIEFVGSFEERAKEWRTGLAYGERIPTGLAALDKALSGGATRKEVWYFLAAPKGAKTTCLLRVALGAARKRYGVLVETFEMQAMRMALRLDRTLSRQTKNEIARSTRQLSRSMESLQQSGAEIYIEERPPQQVGSVSSVERRVEKIRRDGGKVDVVVMDYLNIMGAGKTEKEKRHELPRISRDMGRFARDADVLVWSAALVNRQAVDKRVIRKTDIAEAFEVVAVADGMVAICATKKMVQNGLVRLWVAAAREEQDEVLAGDYKVNFETMTIDQTDSARVDILLAEEGYTTQRQRPNEARPTQGERP